MSPVAAWMVEWNFVVTDDAVVEVGNVKCAIRSNSQIDRTKPAIVTGDKIRLCVDQKCRTNLLQSIMVNDAIHRIADVDTAAVTFWKMIGCVKGWSANPRGAVTVIDHCRRKSQSIVRFSEAGVVAFA